MKRGTEGKEKAKVRRKAEKVTKEKKNMNLRARAVSAGRARG